VPPVVPPIAHIPTVRIRCEIIDKK
jgi:hypothetical protein